MSRYNNTKDEVGAEGQTVSSLKGKLGSIEVTIYKDIYKGRNKKSMR